MARAQIQLAEQARQLQEREQRLVAHAERIEGLARLVRDNPAEAVAKLAALSGSDQTAVLRTLAEGQAPEGKAAALEQRLVTTQRQLEERIQQLQAQIQQQQQERDRGSFEQALADDVEAMATGRGNDQLLEEAFPYFAAMPVEARRAEARRALEWCLENGRRDVSLDDIVGALDKDLAQRYEWMQQRRGSQDPGARAQGAPTAKPGPGGQPPRRTTVLSNRQEADTASRGARRELSEWEALEEAGRILVQEGMSG